MDEVKKVMAILDCTEEEAKKIAAILECTKEEAIDIIKTDKRIDRGEKLFSLNPEQEKASKKARRAPTVYNFDPSKRKKVENLVKRDLIQQLHCFLNGLNEVITNIQVINPERIISFDVQGNTYEFTLVQKRKPKN